VGPSRPQPTHPKQPPNRPGQPPAGPTKSALADDLLFATVDAILDDLLSPARRDPFSAAVGADAIATPGGPAQATRVPPGECLSPGSGAAAGTAVTESAGSVVDPVQAQVRAGRPPAPGTGTFSVPPTPAVRPFTERTPPFEFGAGVALYDVLPKR